MYREAIKKNRHFTWPLLSGIKYYEREEIVPGIATFIMINEDGWALTCRHVAEEVMRFQDISQKYPAIKKELATAKTKNERKKIEKKYQLAKNTIVLAKHIFPINAAGHIDIKIIIHPHLDLALLNFKNVKTKLEHYPVFAKNDPEQGQSLCRLGFSFPEFDCLQYNEEKTEIIFNEKGRKVTPIFPLDGIVTRGIVDERGVVSMFELSSPGLRGQSGGPLFNKEGYVYGLQSQTKHVDLAFDINMKVMRAGEVKAANAYSFLHLGVAITVSEIKKFLQEHQVSFLEANEDN